MILRVSYALRECHSALLTGSKAALASCSQGAAGGGRWLLTAVRGHLGDTRPKCVGQVLGGGRPTNDRTRRIAPAAPGICPVAARSLQGMAPVPWPGSLPGPWPSIEVHRSLLISVPVAVLLCCTAAPRRQRR